MGIYSKKFFYQRIFSSPLQLSSLTDFLSDKSSTEIATDPVENLRESAPKHKENIKQTANSTSITEAKSTHFHHSRREFCRKCCHTPPCWYKNHKKCSKCANNRQSKIFIKRILQRSHRKAAKHHLRRMAKQL